MSEPESGPGSTSRPRVEAQEPSADERERNIDGPEVEEQPSERDARADGDQRGNEASEQLDHLEETGVRGDDRELPGDLY